MGALISVSLASHTRYVPLNTEFRYDDWCIATVDARTMAQIGSITSNADNGGRFYLVTFRATSRAKRRPQRAPDAGAYLIDSQGRRYDVSSAAQAALDATGAGGEPLGSLLNPGASVQRTLVFDVPGDAKDVGAVVQHGGGSFPVAVIIGDENSLLHPPTITRLGTP